MAFHGIIAIDKPKGPTSHDVVSRVRKRLGTRAVGHAGTLDPMASGVLVLLVGEGTKLASYCTAADKTYEAELRFGVVTDSLDSEGTITDQIALPAEVQNALTLGPAASDVPVVAQALEGEALRQAQIPPALSAIKIDGRRSYAMARAGETVHHEPRPVEVRHLQWLDAGLVPHPWARVRLTVSKGYYVRSFARDFAQRLETGAHLTALRRLNAGPFSLEDCVAFDSTASDWATKSWDLGSAVRRLFPTSTLTEEGALHAQNGRPLPSSAFVQPSANHDGPEGWFTESGLLVALGMRNAQGEGRVLRGFRHEPS